MRTVEAMICLSAFSVPICAAAQKLPTKPNIIFILADDMGIGDLGCYGQTKIHTPNIDALAAHGLLFTHHYSGSTVSAPSRCCLLTGKHTGHAYVRGNKGQKSDEGFFDLALPKEETTVAEILKSQGYSTMCVGKWGLGGPHTEGSPLNHGFDYFFGYLSQGAAHRYYPDYLYENDQKVWLGGKVYSHFMIMERGLDFIRHNAQSPFFAYFAITPPHADLDYPDLSEYESSFPETPYINNKKTGFKSQAKPKAAYASMVSEIDRNVGQVLKLLDSLKLTDNTIVIFSSDNGVHCVGGNDPDFFDSNGPFRGYKRDLYEGGVRAPFIVSWPKVIAAARKTARITTFWDFLPTVCDIVGAKRPARIDGYSYLPTLQNSPKKQLAHRYVYYEFYEQGGKQSILDTSNGYKLVRLNMSHPDKIKEELYNINRDIDESDNLIESYPRKAATLRKKAMQIHVESPNFNWNDHEEK